MLGDSGLLLLLPVSLLTIALLWRNRFYTPLSGKIARFAALILLYWVTSIAVFGLSANPKTYTLYGVLFYGMIVAFYPTLLIVLIALCILLVSRQDSS
jgi:hypothetical protein